MTLHSAIFRFRHQTRNAIKKAVEWWYWCEVLIGSSRKAYRSISFGKRVLLFLTYCFIAAVGLVTLTLFLFAPYGFNSNPIP